MATVGQLMSSDLSVITEDATVKQAAGQMQDQRIGSLLVKKETIFPELLQKPTSSGPLPNKMMRRGLQWLT